MPKSTSSLVFPDINVWLSLTYERHVHHSIAGNWFRGLPEDAVVCFCRFTQMGLLRLLTTEAIMGSDGVLSQVEAWHAYDQYAGDDRTIFLEEPPTVESRFRFLSQGKRSSPKDWADAYLAAFAAEAGVRLVTFDQALQKKCPDAHILTGA